MTHDLEDVERRPRERLERLPPAARAELLRVLMLPSFDLRATGVSVMGSRNG